MGGAMSFADEVYRRSRDQEVGLRCCICARLFSDPHGYPVYCHRCFQDIIHPQDRAKYKKAEHEEVHEIEELDRIGYRCFHCRTSFSGKHGEPVLCARCIETFERLFPKRKLKTLHGLPIKKTILPEFQIEMPIFDEFLDEDEEDDTE
ncbi:MAG: hypothetical protein A4E20_06505 [Nitrospira sp. SG-bin2]|nr:MAG: hypothetical protein A4E20_06505 [Nitrospira sp. SG-bin2]